MIQRELAALVMAVHRDDAGGLEQPGAHHGSIAAGAAAENHHGVPFLDLSQLRAKIAGGQHAADGKNVFVCQIIGDQLQTVVGDGNADILRLAAVDLVAQIPTALYAVVNIAAFTEEALAAEGLYVGDDAVAHLDFLAGIAHGNHFTGKLMTQNDVLVGGGHSAHLDMEVTGADGGQSNPYDGVPGILNGRNGTILQTKIVNVFKHITLHGFSHSKLPPF